MLTNIENNNLKEDEIISIEEIDYDGYVYDACCEDPHLYLTNDFVSHNCILWIDEIEKAISGGKSSGATDGGTTSRVLSTFLTWMQEKRSSVFVVATANDHESIPSEFLRAGRFDEIFYVDFPNEEERKEIIEVLLKKRKLKIKDFDTEYLSKAISGYSGAEIEKCIDCAMIKGFIENKRKITTKDIFLASKEFKPLSVMREADFVGIREWAETRCRKASSEPKNIVNIGTSGNKDLDI